MGEGKIPKLLSRSFVRRRRWWSEMGHRASPAPFLTKTYQLVDDPITDDVVSWNESGTTFVVWNTADFARDLLPSYFKHNNFSSFIRQLNTYGFRKIVPDKWEFANDNFKRDKKELLTLIRRRKTAAGKSAATCDRSSPSHSSGDLESTSTSLLDFKNGRSTEEQPVRAPFVDLSEENEKLKRDNELLITELAQTKQQCEELINLLAKYTDVRPDQIAKYINVGSDQMDRIMKRASCRSTHDGLANLLRDAGDENNDCDGLKLFGVWVKGNEKKRCRSENMGVMGDQRKEMKTADVDAPWMKITSFGGETSKVCNWFEKSMGVCGEARAPSSSVLFLHG